MSDEERELYRKARDRGSVTQFIAYYLVVGSDSFVKGPHDVVVQLVLSCNFKKLVNYATLARGKLDGFAKILMVFNPKDEQRYVKLLLKNLSHMRS